MQTYTLTGEFTLEVSAGAVTVTGAVVTPDSPDGYPTWVRPEYRAGQIVRHNGQLYRALRDNAYAPTTSAWAPYTPTPTN